MAVISEYDKLFKLIDRGSKEVERLLKSLAAFAEESLYAGLRERLGEDLALLQGPVKMGRFVNRSVWVGFTPELAGIEDRANGQPVLALSVVSPKSKSVEQHEFRVELFIGSKEEAIPFLIAFRDLLSGEERELITSLGKGFFVQLRSNLQTRTPVTRKRELANFSKFLGAHRPTRLQEFLGLFGDDDARRKIEEIQRQIEKNTISIEEYEKAIADLTLKYLGEQGTDQVAVLYPIDVERFERLCQQDKLDQWVFDRFDKLIPVFNRILELAGVSRETPAEETETSS